VNNRKKALVFGFILSAFAVASFAETRPEWRPLKFDFALAPQAGPAEAAAFSTMEITAFGGYMGGFGRMTAKNVASDLLTGVSSPWYGAGYAAFSWLGSGVPAALDADMTAPLLTKDGAGLAGIMLGFNISRTFQWEAYIGYGFTGFSFDPAAWKRFEDSRASSVLTLQSYGRTVQLMDKSVAKAGKTILAGFNFNLSLATKGTIRPYLSLGAGLMSISDLPSVARSLSQATSGSSSAVYGLEISYAKKAASLLSGALGLKCFLGPSYGLKIEVRGNMAMVFLDKAVATTFQRSDNGWIEYTPYSATALKEKGAPIFVTAIVGFFYGI
jgi:hypothetical protein